MDRDTIIQQIKSMPLDYKTRIQHCASDRSMAIARTFDGGWWKCFRCGEKGSFKTQPTMQELRDRRKAYELLQPAIMLNDTDFTDELPDHAVAFIVGRGLWPAVYNSWTAWHVPSNRLAMRMVFNGEQEGWLLRDTSVPRPKPKYIQRTRHPYVTPTFVAGKQIVAPDNPYLTITEDTLSACKVSLALHRHVGMALVGTHAQDAILARILEINPICVGVWLDPDYAGRIAAPKLLRSLALMGIPVRNIKYGSKDPKHYTVQEISEELNNHYK